MHFIYTFPYISDPYFNRDSTSSSRFPPWFTKRCLNMPPASWLTTAASLPTIAQEDCARLTLVRFSSVGRAPTSSTEPSVQLDLESGTICRRTSDSRTCHTAVSHSRFYLDSSGTEAFNCAIDKLFTYLLSWLLTSMLTYLVCACLCRCRHAWCTSGFLHAIVLEVSVCRNLVPPNRVPLVIPECSW